MILGCSGAFLCKDLLSLIICITPVYGRICFLNYLNQNEQEIIKFLQKKAENAKKVANIEELSKISNQMVYLYD